MSQADVTAVSCWSFARNAKPKLTESIRAPRLDEIAARAEQIPEFGLNAPEF